MSCLLQKLMEMAIFKAVIVSFRWPNMSITYRNPGEIVSLRYITTDGRIEMGWPCRVVVDNEDLLALYIAANSTYKAGPKRSALEKLSMPRWSVPPNQYIWSSDTLRLMFPGRNYSIWLFWDGVGEKRSIAKYYINFEEPFRRTPIGFDTQDHTLDIEMKPTFEWNFRDTEQLNEHLVHGFYSQELVSLILKEAHNAVHSYIPENRRLILEWSKWTPPINWDVPNLPENWVVSPVTLWEKHYWAYGRLGRLKQAEKTK